MGVRWKLCNVALILWLAVQAACYGQAAPANHEAEAFDSFLYLSDNSRDEDATSTIVLTTIQRDGFRTRDIFASRLLSLGWNPIAVIAGRLYAVGGGDLLAVDMATGEALTLSDRVDVYTYSGGRLYLVDTTSGILWAYDLRSQTKREVCEIAIERNPQSLSIKHPQILVSPSQRFAAFWNWTRLDGDESEQGSYRLQVVDLATGEQCGVGPHTQSVVFPQGEGDFTADEPPVAWLDDQTMLVCSDRHSSPARPADDSSPLEISLGNRIESPGTRVATLDVVTGDMKDHFVLPRFLRGIGEPTLRIDGDGTPRIVLESLGQYRIDLANDELIEDDMLAGEFRRTLGRDVQQLLHGDTVLAEVDAGVTFSNRAISWHEPSDEPVNEAVDIVSIAPSPDQRRILWKSKSWHELTERYYCFDGTETRVVAEGQFPSNWPSNAEIWVSSRELENGPTPAPPGPWMPIGGEPWKEDVPVVGEGETREEGPQLGDVLQVHLTSQAQFRQHEPVPLTLRVVNTSLQDITLSQRRRNKVNIHLMSQIGCRHTFFEGFDDVHLFDEEFDTLQPGEEYSVTRSLEPYELGMYEISAKLSLSNSDWERAAVSAPLKFTIKHSADAPLLLREKFERQMLKCRQEFERDPKSCKSGRITAFGPDATQPLVEVLQTSDDPLFRVAMGRALLEIADESALPYLGSLLADTELSDASTALEVLDAMRARSTASDEALQLMAGALTHKDPRFRRLAAEYVYFVDHRAVAAGFRKAIDDTDPTIATIAACYLAARDGCELEEWFAKTAAEPTQARLLASRSIITRLEEQWQTENGVIADSSWADVARDPAKLERFRQVLSAWQTWAKSHPRSSAMFFKIERGLFPRDLIATK